MLRLIFLVSFLLLSCGKDKNTIHVIQDPNDKTRCTVSFHDHQYPCVLGEAGITSSKHEGDKYTPSGLFPIVEVYYRGDKLPDFNTNHERVYKIAENYGWSSTPGENYNQFVTFSTTQLKSAKNLDIVGLDERLWRNDDLYDIVVVLGYNMPKVKQGRGSAIFMHVASPNFTPTKGCIALKKQDLLEIAKYINTKTKVKIIKSN